MNKKINIKSIVIVFFAMIIGIYLIFFQSQIITGLFIIAGGISLNFLEVAKWIKELISFFKSFNKDDDEPESEKTSGDIRTNVINIGDNANFHGDTAVGGSKIVKK
ncbi:MAG: hypothetical protein WCV90_06930 [Candidatus Woesearchaeota archaeon]|jgi:cell shape-determining protein MreC